MESHWHIQSREKLVKELMRKNITDSSVLEAIRKVPRHLFVEKYLEQVSYEDRALPIAAGQTISQPYTVAFQTQLLQVARGLHVLEIGTGSGYQSAVLYALGARVYTIERQRELYLSASRLLPTLGYRVNMMYGDGYMGIPGLAPFERILITAGAPEIPANLLKQLSIEGVLVCPVGEGANQHMVRVVRKSETEFEQTNHGLFTFVPMLKGTS